MSNLFSFFRQKQFKPVWEFNTSALIWRIFFTSTNNIIGEVRDQTNKTTKYFCIDALAGKPLWKDIGFDEPWWIGVEAVHDRWLILHGFVRPEMPEHRGILVIEIESGKLLWRNEDISYWFIGNDKLYAHKYYFEKRIGYEIDITTGSILNEYDSNLGALHDIRKKAIQQEFDNHRDIIFPKIYDDAETDQMVKTMIQNNTDAKGIEGCTEYITYRDTLVLSRHCIVHDQSGPQVLNNILSIYNLANGDMLYSEIIAEGVKVPSHDTFFVKGDLLYFVKHKTILTAMKPWN